MKPSRATLLAGASLSLLLLALHGLGGEALRAAWRYERAAIAAGGEPWRLLTAHFVHGDSAHLAWNLAGLALVVALVGDELRPWRWAVVGLASALAVGLGLYLWSPEVAWYLGFSGVLHGLLLAGLLAQWLAERSPLTLAIAGVLAAKLLYEQFAGPLPFLAGSGSTLPVVHAAHGYGAAGGLAGFALLGALRR